MFILLWIGVVEVVVDADVVDVVLEVATLVAIDEVGDVIRTEPLFRLLIDEDVHFFLAQNFSFVCTVCNSGFGLLF